MGKRKPRISVDAPGFARRRRAPRHPESDLQISLIEYWKRCVPKGECLVFAVPNGGFRNALEAARLVEEGVMPGVADLVILLPGGRIHFAEVKTAKDALRKIDAGEQNDAQRAFQAAVTAMGFGYSIVRSPEEWWELLQQLGVRCLARPYVAQSYQPVRP